MNTIPFQVPFLLMTDGYKPGHPAQYPELIERLYLNFTARAGRDPLDNGVLAFGLQGTIQRYFIEYVNQTFFWRNEDEVCAEYEQAMLDYFGPNSIGTDHVRALHRLGYLPLEIRALPEGTHVPYGVPVFTVESTAGLGYAWIASYIETLLSSLVWHAMTSATTAFKYRQTLEYWARLTGTAPEFIDWQAHDFSFRGMTSPESAMLSGAAHLTSFTGSDTMPAISYLKRYYAAEGLIGGSVPATEHSVMCAGGVMDGVDAETAVYRRLINEVYPDAAVMSIVSDTRNLWEVLDETVRALKDDILARPGKVVIRPDSGDPVLIICGDPNAPVGSFERKGVIQILWEIFGGTETEQGFRLLNEHIGCIYGDSITLERANEICRRLAEQGFASGNIVLGVGSYTYQYATRDTHGFAYKATWCVVDGEEHLIYKKPFTDSGTKNSAKGRLIVERVDGKLTLVDNLTEEDWVAAVLEGRDEMRTVFIDGETYNFQTLADVRARVQAELPSKVAA